MSITARSETILIQKFLVESNIYLLLIFRNLRLLKTIAPSLKNLKYCIICNLTALFYMQIGT